jgi:putative oligomerization/nucleic acid binding protein
MGCRRAAHRSEGYDAAMVLRPLRRAPMMLGGVGFQVGLDEARQKQIEAQRQAVAQAPPAPRPDVVGQLKQLKELQDEGVLSPEEFAMAKRKLLDG